MTEVHSTKKPCRMRFDTGEVYVRGYRIHRPVSHMFLRGYTKPPNWKETVAKPLRVWRDTSQGILTEVPNYGTPTWYDLVGVRFDWLAYAAYYGQYRLQAAPHLMIRYNKEFASRSWQMLNFHAHTIQLFFKYVVRKKQIERMRAVDYLHRQQTENHYLADVLVLQNIFSFIC